MNKVKESAKDHVWTVIEKEKKRDFMIKLISKIAWSITLLIVIGFLVITVFDFSKAMTQYHSGMVPYKFVIVTLEPFFLMLGGLSLLIAILATVGMFLRLRTTTLLEIQQRLANLEGMITSEQS